MNTCVSSNSKEQFPKIGKWGDMDFPYPEATFEQLKDALLGGGKLRTFIYAERAAANFIALAWKEGIYKDVSVFTTGMRASRVFNEELAKSLKHLGMEKNISRLNDGFVVCGGSVCTIQRLQESVLRGVGGDAMIFICDSIPEQFTKQILVPIMASSSGVAAFQFKRIFDDRETLIMLKIN
jgi:hypothetical protein